MQRAHEGRYHPIQLADLKLKALLLFAILAAAPTLYGGVVTGTMQGPSGIAVKNATLTFQLQQAGLIIGSGNVAQLTSQCYTSTDGSVVGLPNPLQPTTVATGPTATLPSGIYYLRFTFYNSAGESLPSPEFHIQTTVLQSLIVSPPASFPPNATGINIYIGASSGTETLQGSTTSGTGQYAQSAPLISGSSLPTANSAPCTIAFNDTIIPFSGYNVSLTSATGNAYPGWPQAWQLNGGLNGTINVAQGAPLWNGVVQFPMPILSQPLNHGQQSISGPLDFGDYDVTNMGNTTSCSVNGAINVESTCYAQYPDLGDKVAAALASCANQCTLYVPAGSYSYATTILLPLSILNGYRLALDPGAVLNYTGSGDAVLAAPAPTSSPSVANLRISGGRIHGTNAGNGIHVVASNTINISDTVIDGFANGILLDGPNQVNIDHNVILNNTVGIQLIPTFCTLGVCGPTPTSGSAFTTNAIHIDHNTIFGNVQWAILDSNTQPANTGSLNNLIDANDLEGNGTGGSQYGAIQILRGSGYHITNNYFEGSPRQIVLGSAPLGSPFYFAAQQTTIDANHFTELIGTPYSIELVNATYTRIENNDTVDATMNAGNCFVNAGSASNSENHTLFGQNEVLLSGGGNVLCIGGGGALAFAGAGSYMTVNNNYLMQAVNVNYAIANAGTSETISLSANVNASSVCQATPAQSGSVNVTPVAVIPTGSNTGTFYHPASQVGTRWNISCEPGPFN